MGGKGPSKLALGLLQPEGLARVGTLEEHLRSLLTPGWGHSPEGVAPKTSSAGTDPGCPLGFRATARPPPPRTLPADGKPAVPPGGGSARRRAQAPAQLTIVLALDEGLPVPEPLHADAVDDAGRLLGLERLVQLGGVVEGQGSEGEQKGGSA